MSPRTLRTAALWVALVALLAQSGCSKDVTAPAKPPVTPPPPPPPVNQPPDSWFAGPDPTDGSAGWQTEPGPFGGRFIPVSASWSGFAGVPHTMLSADSLQLLPKARAEHRTFFEIYGDRVWLRQEGDTVHMNSYVILPSGGSDADSPYSVQVNVPLLPPPLLGTPVFTPGPKNGSPIGFRLRVLLKDAFGQVDQPSESTTYPVYDPASVLHDPTVNGYRLEVDAGRAYAVARAVDGDGAVDRRIDRQSGDAVGIADRVDAGGGSLEDRALRSKILTFYVDYPARLSQDTPFFRPAANQVFTSRTLHAGTDLALYATDDDAYDLPAGPVRPGGPSATAVLRRRIAILGKFAGDPTRDTCYVVPGDFINPAMNLTIPDWIANGPITLLVRLCDCYSCDVRPGPGACPAFAGEELRPTYGTCVDTSIPCQLAVPGPTATADR